MENTSKVLLIAAAVLVVILIVTVSIGIFHGIDSVFDDADDVGKGLSESSQSASEKAIYLLEDLNGKSLIKVEQHEADAASNQYYSSYFPQNPKILLEPNSTYMLSFNYKVNYADYNVGCGIGCGESAYILDIVTNKIYYYKNSNKTEGKFEYTFTTPQKFMKNIRDKDKNIIGQEEVKVPYLHIRFARMSTPGNCSVEISNVRFKKV